MAEARRVEITHNKIPSASENLQENVGASVSDHFYRNHKQNVIQTESTNSTNEKGCLFWPPKVYPKIKKDDKDVLAKGDISLNDTKENISGPCSFESFADCVNKCLDLQNEDVPEGYDISKFLQKLKYHDDVKKECDPVSRKLVSAQQTIVDDANPITDLPAKIEKQSPSNRPKEKIPPLKFLNKRPETIWYQTDYCLYLSVYLPDVISYYLKVSKDVLILSANVNNVQQTLVLNFFAPIQPEYTSHENKGLRVFIRLVKAVFISFPRLLQQSVKFPWLKYDLNNITLEENEPKEFCYHSYNGLQNSIFPYSPSDSDDNDDEEYLYKTYNRVSHIEDV